jgi:hypothetical protein
MKLKKPLIVASIILLVLIIAPTIAVIVVYKNQKGLTQDLIHSLNQSFEGELSVGDSHIAPFANFPYISLDFSDVTFLSEKFIPTDTIYHFKDVYVGFRIWDILKGNLEISSIKLTQGDLNLSKDLEGKINLLTAKSMHSEQEKEEPTSKFNMDLASILLSDVEVKFHDQGSLDTYFFHIGNADAGFNMGSEMIKIRLLSKLIFDMELEGEPTFFSNKHIDLDFLLDYNLENSIVKLQRSNFSLEGVRLNVSGQVDLDDDWNMDIRVNGEKPDFNLIAAFLPQESGDFVRRYKNEGDVFFQGRINGKISNGNTPAIGVEFGCDNAYFLNPEREKKVEDLRFSAFYTNGSGRNLQTSEFQLLNFNAKPEQGTFQGRLIVKDFTNPYIDINLNADLDLGFLGEFFEIEGLQGISGQVIVNMDFNELIDLDDVGISGVDRSLKSELIVRNLNFSLPDFPYPIRNTNVNATLEKGNLRLNQAQFHIADSDFSLEGKVLNFPSLFHGEDKEVKADLKAFSKKIDLEELFVQDTTAWKEVITDFEIKLAFESTGNEIKNYQYIPKGEFFIEDFHAKLKHYPHAFHDFHADIIIGEEDLAVIDFTGEIDKTDFHFSGKLQNYSKWFQETPKGKSILNFDLVSDHLAIKDLLTYAGENYLPADYQEEEIDKLNLKGSLELVYDSIFQSADLYLTQLEGKMNIHPLRLENFKGRVHYEDQFLTIENFQGKLGISDFGIQMAYNFGDVPSNIKPKNHFHLTSNRLDLDAIMGYEGLEKEKEHEEAFNIFTVPFSDMDFSAQIGKMNYHTFWLDDVTLKANTTPQHYIYLDTLGFNAADGSLGIKGYFNGSNPDEIYFHSTMVANKVDLDKLLFKFENFGQDYLINENLHGLVSGTITSKFLVHPDLTPIIEKSEANMNLTVYQGRLVDFAPLQAMGDYFKDRNLRNVRFDTLANTFELKEGILNIPSMNINSSLGFIELSGKQSLDMNMEYFLRIPLGLVTQVGFRSLFGGKSAGEIDPDREDAIVVRDQNRRVRFVNISMKGTPDDYQIGLGRDRNK